MRLKKQSPGASRDFVHFRSPNKLRCTALTVLVFVFFVLTLSALFLLTGLSALLSALAVLTGLSALLLAGLSALLSLLAILFHIVCHQ